MRRFFRPISEPASGFIIFTFQTPCMHAQSTFFRPRYRQRWQSGDGEYWNGLANLASSRQVCENYVLGGSALFGLVHENVWSGSAVKRISPKRTLLTDCTENPIFWARLLGCNSAPITHFEQETKPEIRWPPFLPDALLGNGLLHISV